MHDQSSLTLDWRSSLDGGSDIITSIFTDEAGNYCDYRLMPLPSTVIIHNARPIGVDAPLTVMSRMGHWVRGFAFYI